MKNTASVTTLKLPFTFDATRLRADAGRFAAGEWTPHFNTGNYEGDWSVVPLRAVKGGVLAIYPDPNAPDGYVETEQMTRCNYVPEVLRAFECELETVRFLKLGAGSRITQHRDYMLGFEDGFVRVHIPVVTNSQVDFVLNDEHLDMQVGEAWYLNVNCPHSVVNAGPTDRIHLVVDCVVNDWLRNFFA